MVSLSAANTSAQPTIQKTAITQVSGPVSPSAPLTGANTSQAQKQGDEVTKGENNQAQTTTSPQPTSSGTASSATRLAAALKSPYSTASAYGTGSSSPSSPMPPMGAGAGGGGASGAGAASPKLPSGGGGGSGGSARGGGGGGCGGGGCNRGQGGGGGSNPINDPWGKNGAVDPNKPIDQYGIKRDEIKDIKETENKGAPVKEITSEADLQKVMRNGLPTIVKVGATWCGPCKELDAKLPSMYKDLKGKANIVTIDVDKNPELAKKYMEGNSVPQTTVLGADGKPTGRIEGNSPDQIKALAQQAITANEANLQNQISNRPIETPQPNPQTETPQAETPNNPNNSGLSAETTKPEDAIPKQLDPELEPSPFSQVEE